MRYDPRPALLGDLSRRIDALAGQGRLMSVRHIYDEIDEIRHLARLARLDPVDRLGATLETVVSLHGLGWVVLSYLDEMREVLSVDADHLAMAMPPARPVDARTPHLPI